MTYDSAYFNSAEQERTWREKAKEFAKYYEENYDENGERIVETRDYIDYLIEEFHFKTLSDTEEIWRYDRKRGIYVPNAECMIKAQIEKDYKDKVTNKFVSEQLGRIQRRTYISRSDFNSDITAIKAKTGFFASKPDYQIWLNLDTHDKIKHFEPSHSEDHTLVCHEYSIKPARC